MYCTECGGELANGKCPQCGKRAGAGQRMAGWLEKMRSTAARLAPGRQGTGGEPADADAAVFEDSKGVPDKRRKRKKIWIIAAAGAAVLIAAGAVTAVFLVKDTQYNEAVQMLLDERPRAAAESFEALGGYRDSEAFLEESHHMISYFEANDLFEGGSYQAAADMYATVTGYLDAGELQALSQNHADYETAGALFDAGAFEQAKTVYLALGSFEDSVQLSADCQVRIDYQQATELMDSGEFEQAREIFLTIEEYADSGDKAFVCYCRSVYQNAQENIANENYTRALQLLEQVQNNISMSEMAISEVLGTDDFLQVKDDCERHVNYEHGLKLFEQGKFYSAHQAFTAAGYLYDAKSRAAECIQPIKTAEIYVNPDYARNSVRMTFYAPENSGESICIKVYDVSGVLASVCLVKHDEKLRIYLPVGLYYYEYSVGKTWFGDQEFFGGTFHRVKFTDGSTTQYLSSYYYYWIEF